MKTEAKKPNPICITIGCSGWGVKCGTEEFMGCPILKKLEGGGK